MTDLGDGRRTTTAGRAAGGRDGLAGPEAVAWKINGEVVAVAGWTRAILLQFAHPLVAAAVADHSTFQTGLLGRVRRLRGTLNAMLSLTFGAGGGPEAAAAHINAIHDRVHGRLTGGAGVFPPGAPYSAHDPGLLRWVHATLLDSLPLAYELYVGPLSPEEKDRYCAEASALAPLLGFDDGLVPMSTADLNAYLHAMYEGGEIRVTETARALARDLLNPPVPAPLRPALEVLRLPAVGLLPPRIREAYGFPWDERREAALRQSASVVRRVLPVLPPPLRYWPAARRPA